MAKQVTTIRIDEELLKRIDGVAGQRKESRASVIERMLENEINSEERFVADMENPVIRTLARALVSTPAVTKALAAVLVGGMPADELEDFRKWLPEQVKLGVERETARKAERKKGLAGA